MQLRFLPLLTLILLLSLRAGAADRNHNIFDDDWTPPKASTTPRPPATVKPSTPKPEDPTKVTPPTVPSKETAPISPPPVTPSARLAVPTATAQAAVRKVMKEVFAEQLADRSIPARRKLTTALLTQADKSNDALVDQFVLLAAAIDSAVDAVDLPAAIRAADKMSEKFEVDGLGVKADAALRIGPKSASPDQATENVIAAIDLSDELAKVDDFVIAIRVCSALQPQTAGNAALRSQLQQHIHDLSTARDAAERFARDLAKLSKSPNDPAANLAAGKYACFVKGDWENGLPMLVKGSDVVLKAPATFELSRPSSAEEIAHLADSWWDAATQQADTPSKTALTTHAAALYEPMIDKISGLRKVQIQQRIDKSARSSAETSHGIDLLKLVGKRYKAVQGTWTNTPFGLKSTKGGGMLLLPYAPPEEYDLQVVFERLEGRDSVDLICPLPHGTVCWIAGGGEIFFGFGNQKNGSWTSLTKRELPADTIRNNIRYTCLIRVRKEKATAFFNGNLLSEFNSDGKGCQFDGAKINGKPVLGFHLSSSAEFLEVILKEITGQGSIVNDQK
jgi:hypothetical protein